MPDPLQVVFDCRDPARLAAFYASALGYEVEPPPDGFDTWEAFLASLGVPEEEWGDASAVVDPRGAGPRIFFQRMGTPKPGKNRVHLDVTVTQREANRGVDPREAVRGEVERLKGLGATFQKEWDERGQFWVVMLDPEGNEFCLQ